MILSVLARADKSDVTWFSPATDDIYGPGDILLAKWSFLTPFALPVFKLCPLKTASDLGACSDVFSTSVMQTAGFYQALITVPNIQSNGQYCLQVVDGNGPKMRSPIFHLSPSGASSGAAVNAQAIAADSQAQTPLSAAPSESALSTLKSVAAPGTSSSALFALPTSTQSPSATPLDPNLLSAQTRTQNAAFIVPLSIVGVVLLLAGGLFIRHRRKLAAQHAKDAERFSRADSFKSHCSKETDLDHVLNVLSRHQARAALPVFMPPEYSCKPSQSYAPTYAAYQPRSCETLISPHDPPTAPLREAYQYEERPRLPPIATTTASFISTPANDPATHSILSDYMLPSPPLVSSTSAPTPRCLLPAPQRLYFREDGPGQRTAHPLGTPTEERDLYARVESKLNLNR
ncbi:hypothetical protein C8F01DRAFT_322423 [Mycena amicta]|nr:hypothetical protein C8F01DRAFT_322423 [Mycena amicta]